MSQQQTAASQAPAQSESCVQEWDAVEPPELLPLVADPPLLPVVPEPPLLPVVPELPPEELPLPVRLPEPLLLDAPLVEGELLAPSLDPPDEPHATPHATIRGRPTAYLAIRSERRSIGFILFGRPTGMRRLWPASIPMSRAIRTSRSVFVAVSWRSNAIF